MVNTEKVNNTAMIKYRLGIVLIWLGVLTWLPFIMLRMAGESPSLFLYLPFHLAGVVGGARLRAAARRELNIVPMKRSVLQQIGHIMIFLGILVWAPYFYMKAVHLRVDVMNFLPYHLTGVLGGVTLLGVNYLISQRGETQA